MSKAPSAFSGISRSALVDGQGRLTPDGLRLLSDWNTRLTNGLNLIGEFIGDLSPETKISGRTEGIGTTVQNITSTGQLNSLTNVVADRNLDNISDTASFQRTNPNQVAGAGRAFNALNAASQLAGSFHNNPVNVQSTYTGPNPITQAGTTKTINIGASTQQFGDGKVSYNSGSVTPSLYGTYYIYADDPSFLGGSVIYVATLNAADLTAANGRVYFGVIITKATGGGTGTGGGGGGQKLPVP